MYDFNWIDYRIRYFKSVNRKTGAKKHVLPAETMLDILISTLVTLNQQWGALNMQRWLLGWCSCKFFFETPFNPTFRDKIYRGIEKARKAERAED